ncbi:MAG: hypothetical protein ACM3Q1_11905 [Bacteroidales bacterium]
MSTKEEPTVHLADHETELSDDELEQVAAGTTSDSLHRLKEAGTNAVKNAGKVLSH